MKHLSYFLLTLIAVFVCALLPALGATEIIDSGLWIISIWGAICGSFAIVGSYWIGTMIEGKGEWTNNETKKLLMQIGGAILGGVLACVVMAL